VLAASERWPELARLTQREIQLATERGAQEEALDLMVRLGKLRVQRLNDPRGGLETFQEVLRRKPRHAAAVAALEEMARSGSTLRGEAALALEPVFTADGDYLRLVTVLESRVSAETVPEERTLLLRRMAEIYAEHLESPEQAFITAARALRDVPDDAAALKLCLAFAGPADADDALLDLLEEASARAQVPEIRVAQFRALAQVRERDGDASGAIDAWKHVFEAVAEDSAAVDALIRLLSSENRAPELLEVLRRQLSVLEDVDLRAERMFQIGALQEEALDDPEGALAMFRWLLDLRPDEPRTLARLEGLCARLERWPELADVLARRIKNASGAEALELTFRLAEVRESRLYDPPGALELYGEILARAPSHQGALGRLQAMVERDPHHLAASDVLLQAYRANDNVDKLAMLLDARAASAPDVPERKPFLIELAQLQMDKQGEPELAFMSLLRAFRDDPNDADVRLRLEGIAEAAQTWDELSGVYEEELLRIAEPKDAAEVCVKLGEIFDERLSQPERAVECFEKARALDETVWLKALPSLDRLYNQLSRPENLAEVLEKLAELAEDPKAKIGYLFRLGQLAHEVLETPDRSVKVYEQILALDPNHLATARLLEELYEELGQAKQLYRILEHQRDRAQGPERERIFLKMAQISAESPEDVDRSIQIYKDLLAKNPRNEQAWMALQALLEATGRYDELRQMITARLKQTVDPREVVRLNDRLGRVVWKLGNKPDEAVAFFKAALERDPRHKGALEALRDIHEAADRKAELVTVLRRLVALQEDVQGVKKVRVRLAEVLAAMSRREEALDAARRSLEVEPHDPADLGRVSHVFISLRAYADAARTMDLRATALAAAGENEEAVRVLFEIADLCKGQLQRPENAAPAMVKILELDPANRRAFDTARELFRKQNDWTTWAQVTDRFLPHISAEDEKLATLRELVSVQENKLGQKDVAFLTACRALHLDAANDGVREEVERLADETGSYEEMAAVYEELADNLPQGAIAERLYLTLAKVHDEQLDDPAAAETALRKILEFDPTSPVALESLSAMFARRGRDKEYLTSLEQQLEAAGTIEQRKAILAQIAHVYDTKFQDATEAATALQRSLELEADGPTFTALLALYRREKAWPEVAQTLTRWRDLASTPEERAKLQAEVAGVYEKEIGDDEAAVEAYREALELDPHNHEAVESLEHLYTKLDRPADLLAVYDRQREASQDPRERVSVLVKSAAIWEEKFNNPANAAEYVELILAEDPYNLQAIKTLERLRRTEERWDALVGVLERHVLVSTSDEERAALSVEMGDVFHQSLRQVDKAVATYHRALELDRRNLGAMHALGQIYERSGNWPFALEMLAKEAELAGATPHAVELYHRMGKIQDEMLMDVSSARAAF
ncbi:MAG TPA: gliding motility protein, partial [Myxococcaceae bacterium]|nr:gliding motility protein [Myxococcaceae bacterium]